MTDAERETEGLAASLVNLVVHVYDMCPHSRPLVAEVIAWFDGDREKVWERRDEDMPDKLTKAQAKASVDRLRTIWRDDGFQNDPLERKDWPQRMRIGP
jgi:hypothetical protein